MRLEFQIIIPNSVFNGILIRKVFQIEVSDGREVNLHPARVFTGARVFRSLYVFRVPNHHSKECVQSHLNRKSISNRGFRWSSPFPWESSKSKLAYCQGVYGSTSFQDFLFTQSFKPSFQRVCTIAYLQDKYFKSRFQMVQSIPLELVKK